MRQRRLIAPIERAAKVHGASPVDPALLALGALLVACDRQPYVVLFPEAAPDALAPEAGADPCAGFVCEAGECAVVDGQPRCVCPPGTLRDGEKCVACSAFAGEAFDLRWPSRQVRVDLRVDGRPVAQGASVNLRGVDSGLRATLNLAGAPTWVLAGRYRLSYEGSVGLADGVPSNRGRALGELDVVPAPPGDLDALQTIAVSLRSQVVEGTLDLGPAHEELMRSLNLAFVEEASSDTPASRAAVSFLDMQKRRFHAVVTPGDYRVALTGATGGSQLLFQPVRLAGPAGAPLWLDLRLPADRVEITLRRSAGPEPNALLYLQGTLGRFRMTPLDGLRWQAVVPHGDYKVTYALLTDGMPGTPLQITAPVLAEVRVDGPRDLPVDLDQFRARGRVTIGGRAPSVDGIAFRLRSSTGGTIPLALAADGSFERWLMPGSYWVQYECRRAPCRDGWRWPANREASLGPVELRAGTGEQRLDFAAAEVDLDVTESGGPGLGTLELAPGPGPTGLGGATGALVVSDGAVIRGRVVRGDYTAVYRRTRNGVLSWRVGRLAPEAFDDATAPVRVRWDLPLKRLRGRIGAGDGSAPRSFRLDNPELGYVSFETDAEGRFAIDVPAGAPFILRQGPGVGTGAVGCWSFP